MIKINRAVIGLLSLGLAQIASAQSFWTNTAASGSFTNDNNWNPVGIPAATTVNFTNNFIYTVDWTRDVTNTTAQFNGTSGVITQNIASGNIWRLTSNYLLGQVAGSTAQVVQTGGRLSVGGNLTVGNAGRGTFVLNGGAVTVAGTTFIGSNSVGQLSLNGGTWTNSGAMFLGNLAGRTGTLAVTSGQYVQTAGPLTLGTNASSIGIINLTGGQINLTLGSLPFFVGQSGQGTLTINGGSLVITSSTTSLNGGLIIGGAPGGSGMVNLQSGVVTNFSGLTLGNPLSTGVATGMLTMSGGTWMQFGSVNIGRSAGRGTFTISDGRFEVRGDGASTFLVGNSGPGVLNMTGGTLVLTNLNPDFGFALGQANGQPGTVTFSGGVISNFSNLRIGLGNFGSSGGITTSTVTQTGGTWVQQGDTIIGGGGTQVPQPTVGQLTINGGVFLVSSNVTVGSGTNSNLGSLTIGGTGQMRVSLGTNGKFTLGQGRGGQGTLTINGGSLFITNQPGTTAYGLVLGGTNGASGAINMQSGVVTNFTPLYVGNPFDLNSGVSTGIFTMTGGTWVQFGSLSVGRFNGRGTLTINDGRLEVRGDSSATNSFLIGNSGPGVLNMTGGTLVLTDLHPDFGFGLGQAIGQPGTVTFSGGVISNFSNLRIGLGNFSGTTTSTVLQTGGTWIQRGDTIIGGGGTVSPQPALGRLTVNGGLFHASSNVTVGFSTTGTGSLTIGGTGLMRITNATGTAVLDVRRGSLIVTGGTLLVDKLLATNANAVVSLHSGTLATGNTFVTNNASFLVGNGVNNAMLDLRGGNHSFNNGLTVTNNGAVQIANSTATINASFLTVQSGGLFTASTAQVTINSVFTNAGTVKMFNSVGTFNRAVVNQGAWITDPTTNIFNANHSITASGYISAAAGDVFVFRSNLVNQSSQSLTWNTLNVAPGSNTVGLGTKFIFQGTGLTQTQLFQHTGLLITDGFLGIPVPPPTGVQTTQSLNAFIDNFAVGRLELTNTTLFLAQATPSSTVTNALFVNDLFFFGAAHLIISNNMRLYFVNSNDWTMANVTLLGNAEIHQLVLVPEPSTLLLFLTGACVLGWWRRKK